jgi:hypothetical protein
MLQKREELSLVLINRVGAPELLQVCETIGAQRRAEAHIHQLLKAGPGDDAVITLEGVIPFYSRALEVQRCHSDPLVRQRPHAVKVHRTFVEPRQGICFTIKR